MPPFTPFSSRVLFIFLLIGSAALALPGCSSQSVKSMTPQEMWQAGKEKAQKGEKIVSSQQQKLDDGRRMVREGEALIERGTEAVEISRVDYQKASKTLGGASRPDQVEFESERFAAIAEKWKQGVEDIKRGNAMISKGNDHIEKAQSRIMEGRKLIDEGSRLMIQSQTATSEI